MPRLPMREDLERQAEARAKGRFRLGDRRDSQLPGGRHLLQQVRAALRRRLVS